MLSLAIAFEFYIQRSTFNMIKAIDFFCGAGGLTRGLLNAGISVLAGVDIVENLRRTYAENNTPARFINRDIATLNIHALRRLVGISNDDKVVYAACTPCQPFSTLNQRRGDDPRKQLLLSFAGVVQAAPPDVILIENVPGLNTKYGREIYEKFLTLIEEVGFRREWVNARFLDAHDFNVPQTRKRFILLASRSGPISLPDPSNIKPNVADYIQRFPRIAHGTSSRQFKNHKARPLQPHHLRIVKAIPRNGGSRQDISDTSILLKCHQNNPNVHKDVFGRMKWDAPAPTLTARCTDVYCGRFVHPSQNRGISVREAAALQTFDDNYIFYGDSILQLARQIGNSVPVNFASALGTAIQRHLAD